MCTHGWMHVQKHSWNDAAHVRNAAHMWNISSNYVYVRVRVLVHIKLVCLCECARVRACMSMYLHYKVIAYAHIHTYSMDTYIHTRDHVDMYIQMTDTST
jgi:hypothetical protein